MKLHPFLNLGHIAKNVRRFKTFNPGRCVRLIFRPQKTGVQQQTGDLSRFATRR